MNGKQKVSLWAVAAVLAATGIYAPWVGRSNSHQYAWVFLPPSGASPDLSRLALQAFAVVMVGVLVALTPFRSPLLWLARVVRSVFGWKGWAWIVPAAVVVVVAGIPICGAIEATQRAAEAQERARAKEQAERNQPYMSPLGRYLPLDEWTMEELQMAKRQFESQRKAGGT